MPRRVELEGDWPHGARGGVKAGMETAFISGLPDKSVDDELRAAEVAAEGPLNGHSKEVKTAVPRRGRKRRYGR